MSTVKLKFLPSRTGALFGAEVTVDDADGSLTVLTNSGAGERSAHRDAARAHFGTGALWCMNRLSYLNTDGVRVTLTRWNTQAFRRTPAAEVLTMRRADS